MWEQQTNKHETVSESDSISDFINALKIIQKNEKLSRNTLHKKQQQKEQNRKRKECENGSRIDVILSAWNCMRMEVTLPFKHSHAVATVPCS